MEIESKPENKQNIEPELSDKDLFGDGFSDPFIDMGGAGVSPIEKHSDLLKDLTNFDPLIQQRIKNWLGLEWDDKVKDFRQKREAIINQKGARWAIGFLQTYQSKTNFITNTSQNEFKNLQLDIIKVVWLVFPTIEDFDVKHEADWYRLCTELDNSAFLVLAGAADGKYTKFLGESVSRTENVSLSPKPSDSQYAQETGFLAGVKNKLLGR